MSRKKKKKVAVIDLETDPFLFGRKPEPFAAAFYDGKNYVDFWGDDCVERLVDYLAGLDDDYYIYAHNGGKFDFIYFVEKRFIENPVKVINGRIVSAGINGRHVLRDSYAILPMPLSAFQKDEIDYSWFERSEREKNKSDILHYLAKDCEYLYELVAAFVDRFGVKLTIGGTSISKIREYHPFLTQDKDHDQKFRGYYFGGRVQCFNRGHLQGDFKVYDVNSMYPDVMRKFDHPTGKFYFDLVPEKIKFDSNYDIEGFPGIPYFICFAGKNNNALPVRLKTGLDFTQEYGIFYTTSHEFKVAMRYGLIEPHQFYSAHVPIETINFSEFVEYYAAEKVNAKKVGDKITEIFSKFLLNSGYGKFGQNPENFKDWMFRTDDITAHELMMEGYLLHTDYEGMELWERASDSESYFDVATAASITGASRAVLLEGIQKSSGVVYCDTDSIICESSAVDIDKYELGKWDLEKSGNNIYIYAKKIYALYNDDVCVKMACKGVRMTGDDIRALVAGKNYKYKRDAPAFKMNGSYSFVERELKALIDNNQQLNVASIIE